MLHFSEPIQRAMSDRTAVVAAQQPEQHELPPHPLHVLWRHADRAGTVVAHRVNHAYKTGHRVYTDVRLELLCGAYGPLWCYAALVALVAIYIAFGAVPLLTLYVAIAVGARFVYGMMLVLNFTLSGLIAAQLGYVSSGRSPLGALTQTLQVALWGTALFVFPPGAVVVMLVSRACALGRPPPFIGSNWNEDNYALVFFTLWLMFAAHVMQIAPLSLTLGL